MNVARRHVAVIQPAACRASSASAVCRAIQSASGTPNCCPSANRAASDAPSSQGITTSRGGSTTGSQDRHQVRIRDALPHQGLALQQADRLVIVLPARAEHFYGVGGRSICRRPHGPRPVDVRKASQSGKLDQLPLSYPTVRPCRACNAHGDVAGRYQPGLGHSILCGKRVLSDGSKDSIGCRRQGVSTHIALTE